MFHQYKFTFVLVLSMSLFLESHAASDICSICTCQFQTNIDCSRHSLISVPHPIPPTVKYLLLNNNDIKEVKAGTFQNLSSLIKMHLNGNDIEKLENGTFDGLQNLKSLYLNQNNIQKIEIGSIHDLPKLENLFLQENSITNIDRGTFQNLPNLQTLNLQDNDIGKIEKGAFDDLANLRFLYLRNNNIRNIERETFANLPKLQTLHLQKNMIQNCQDGAFLFSPHLTYIAFTDNNDMMCGCHLPAMISFIKTSYNRYLTIEGKCRTDLGTVISIKDYSQCNNYSLFQWNLQCQTCSGVMCNDPEVKNCTGAEPVCENKVSVSGDTLKYEKSCSTYKNCLEALRKNVNTCNKWTSGASCTTCCTGNLCNDFIGRNNSFLFHLIYNSTFKKSNEHKTPTPNVSRDMEHELSTLTGTFEVEYCGLQENLEIFSINCSVPDAFAKENVLEEIHKIFSTSQTLRNLGIEQHNFQLIDGMFCNGNTTSSNNDTFYWPITKVRSYANSSCHANVARRYCSDSKTEMQKCSPFTGFWQEPDMSQCYTRKKPINITSRIFHLIYNSTFDESNEHKAHAASISRAMEQELLKLTGTFEVEYCRKQENNEIFSINYSVADNITNDEVLKQILEIFSTSQALRNLGVQQRNIQLIDKMVCKEDTITSSHGAFYWPMTKTGSNVTIECHAHVATRYCPERPPNLNVTSQKCSPFTGIWQEPDMSQCYNTEEITEELETIANESIVKENVEEISKKLFNISKKSVYFKKEDIDLFVDIQEKMLPLISNMSVTMDIFRVLSGLNNIINTPDVVLVEAERSDGTVSRMLDIIEAISDNIPVEEQKVTALYSNLGVGAIKVEEDTFNGVFYDVSYGNDQTGAKTMILNYSKPNPQEEGTVDFISLPNGLFKDLKDEEKASISRISFFSMKDDKLYAIILNSSTNASTKINSHIIAGNIPNVTITNLDEPVTISFRLMDQNATNPQCVYWDETPGKNPHWSTEGCNISKFISGENVVCSCYHLTSFAVLMDVYKDSVIRAPLLSITSYIGCGISLGFLLLTVIIHACFKNLKESTASQILINLCVSLAASNIVFLVGMHPVITEITIACKAVAALLHFFLLTSVMWMAVEALHIYLSVLDRNPTSFTLKSSILALGLPLVIVIITLVIHYTDNYINIAQVCWISKIPFYAAFLAPVGTILFFNFIIFFLIICCLIRKQSNSLLQEETKKTRILGFIGLISLFGVTWVLEFFAFSERDELFQRLFFIFNALQGMFIFLFYCICDKDVRREAWKFVKCSSSDHENVAGAAQSNK